MKWEENNLEDEKSVYVESTKLKKQCSIFIYLFNLK